MSTAFKSAQYLAEKQANEVEEMIAEKKAAKHDRGVLLGYFVISMIATLVISGALNAY